MGSILFITVAALAATGGLLYNPLKLRAEVVGVLRPLKSIRNIHGEGLRLIPDTVQCEDVHHHLPSGLLFAACQDKETEVERFSWFPPLANFKDHTASARSSGSIVVVDPKTFTSQRLELQGFQGPFITHGIDLYTSPSAPDTVHIFAVNHLPNPAHYAASNPDTSAPKARSQIEIFEHQLGSSVAKHLHSIHDPLIRTPNDLYATSATSFYVTNDHHYREGFLRDFEDLGYESRAPWSDIVHISVDADGSVTSTIAYSGTHNPNGLGHGANSSEILLISAAGGVLTHATLDPSDPSGKKLKLVETNQLQSTLDNPSYYSDPFGSSNDVSGYVLAGLGRAIDMSKNTQNPHGLDPVMVWFVQPNKNAENAGEKWTTRLIFQDDGKTIRSASAAVLIGIDPKDNGGKKQAWLFVTGFLSHSMVATKIDL